MRSRSRVEILYCAEMHAYYAAGYDSEFEMAPSSELTSTRTGYFFRQYVGQLRVLYCPPR
jgi:hypothetical protein